MPSLTAYEKHLLQGIPSQTSNSELEIAAFQAGIKLSTMKKSNGTPKIQKVLE